MIRKAQRDGGKLCRAGCFIVAAVLLLPACSPTKETIQEETHTISFEPIDETQPAEESLYFSTKWGCCDTAAVLYKYFRASTYGKSHGISWGTNVAVRVDTVVQIALPPDSFSTVRVRPVFRTEIVRDTVHIVDRDTVRVTTVEEFTFWDKVTFAITVLLVAGVAILLFHVLNPLLRRL